MRPNPDPEAPGAFEAELRAFWSARRLPEPGGISPAPSGGTSVAFLTPSLSPGAEVVPGTFERLLVMDVAARYVRLTGRGVRPDLTGATGTPGSAAFDAGLERMGSWFGRFGRGEPLARPPGDGLQRALDRLAESGVLRASTAVQRYCPTCAEVRTPQRIRYREELGRAYLVRVPLEEPAPAASLIVWTEAVWKLLATSALLVNPDLPYVRGKFRRRGFEEQIIIARAALPRLEEWMPGGTLEILEERPGSAWAGRRYRSPLSDSVPSMREVAAPAGTLLATPEVNDTGSGIVTLTPAHGPADAQLGRTLHLPGPDVLRSDGLIGGEPRHKYTSLPLDTGEACLLRDLLDDGFVFAELRVRRGVPHCLICGEPTVWRPGSAWGLDLSHLPNAVGELFARLLRDETLPPNSDLLAWPVSDGRPSTEEGAPTLLQCPACSRLSPHTFTGTCPCGRAAPVPTRQRLRPPFEEPISSWLRLRASPLSGPLWLFLPAQRRAPELLHALLASWATGPLPGRDIRVHSIAAVPSDAVGFPLMEGTPADALRLAYLRCAQGRNVRRGFSEALAEEARWVRRFWRLVRGLEEELGAAGVTLPAGAAALRVGELLPEDLGLLSRFERVRGAVLAEYDRGEWEEGLSLIASFLDRELRDGYLRLTGPRRIPSASAASRLAAHRVLAHLLVRLSELLAPVLPFTSEAIHRDIPEAEQSLFEGRIPPVQEALLDADAERSLPVWEGLVVALERARDSWGVGRREPIPQLVLVAMRDEDSARLLPQLPVLARLVGAQKVEIYGPSRPWTQRRVSVRFDKDALRQAYPVYHRRILSVLETLDPRRVREASRTQTLAVAIEGQPAVRVPASMVEIVESLPERFVGFSWPGGEAYAELPASVADGRGAPTAHLPPELTRIVHHLRRRLRAGAIPATAKAFLYVPESLSAELQRSSAAVAEQAGIAQLLVAESPRLFVPAETSYGRTRRGQEWLVWLPGLKTPVRPTKRRRSRRDEPVAIAVSGRVLPEVPDVLSEAAQARGKGIQELLAALDARCGLAALGASKLGFAWDAGFQSVDAFASADPVQLAAVPGFGAPLSWTLLARLAPDRELPPYPVPVHANGENGAAVDGADLAPPEAGSQISTPGTIVEPVPEPIPEPVLTPEPPVRSVPVPVLPPSPPRTVPAFRRLREPEPPPPPVAPAGGVDLDPGSAPDRSWDEFLSATRDGASGLWVGRVFPPALRAASSSADIRFLWLSAANRPNSVRPTDLPGLADGLRAATEQHGVSAVILQEMEYLVTVNGLGAVVGLLRELHTLGRRTGVRVWVPANPELLPEGAVEALRSALAVA